MNHKDLWKSYFEELKSSKDAIFINTVIIDYNRNKLDNNWACYPDAKSLLGFIQYIYLPLAFYYTINDKNEELYIPVRSSSSFIEYIKASHSEHSKAMEAFIQELTSYWELEDKLCLEKIKEFCKRFNAFWKQDNLILNIGVYLSAHEISRYLKDTVEFVEVLEEDIGFTLKQLHKMSKDFYRDKFIQKTFVKILNNNIGCII